MDDFEKARAELKAMTDYNVSDEELAARLRRQCQIADDAIDMIMKIEAEGRLGHIKPVSFVTLVARIRAEWPARF